MLADLRSAVGCCCWALALAALSLATDPPVPAAARPTDGLPNLHRLAEQFWCGGQPAGDAAFQRLAALGVKTVVSVDGAKPDVAAAARHGLRYVHVPIGYDGIGDAAAAKIARAAKLLPGPQYWHCHHGKHRAPAAAALACQTAAGWTRSQSLDWLKQAGTAPEYDGLYAAVRTFVPPPAEALAQPAAAAEFPPIAPVPPLAEAMVAIDEHWHSLESLAKAPLLPAPARTKAARTALLVAEGLRELGRRDPGKTLLAQPAFRSALAANEADAQALHAALSAPAPDAQTVAAAYKAVKTSCAACHRQWRDHRRPAALEPSALGGGGGVQPVPGP